MAPDGLGIYEWKATCARFTSLSIQRVADEGGKTGWVVVRGRGFLILECWGCGEFELVVTGLDGIRKTKKKNR